MDTYITQEQFNPVILELNNHLYLFILVALVIGLIFWELKRINRRIDEIKK